MVADTRHLLLGVVAVVSRHRPEAERDHQLAQVAGLTWFGMHYHPAVCDAAVEGGLGYERGLSVAYACPLPVAATSDYLPLACEELQRLQARFLGQASIGQRLAYGQLQLPVWHSRSHASGCVRGAILACLSGNLPAVIELLCSDRLAT